MKLCPAYTGNKTETIHHKEFIGEVVQVLDLNLKAVYKNVYTSNFDRYLAVLPKDNELPKHLTITNEEVVLGSYKM